MRSFVLLVLFALACGPAGAARDPANLGAAAVPPGAFIVLCYHEVRKDVRDYPDPFAVDDAALVAQLAWLRGNGYTPVSLDEIVAARNGAKALPARAVLLTFDDGYLSFYTRVFPLLREFGYPAVLGVVGAWIDAPRASAGMYGERNTVPDAEFPTWGQLREMAASGLVEIASHTYNLHRGVPANPQGNLEPAATTRVYDAASGQYESDASWRARVRADLARNADLIEREIGRRPRAIVWPYGSYNAEMVRMARELGSPIALTLGDGANTTGVPLDAMRRILVAHNPALPDFVAEVRGPQSPEPIRVIEVDLADLQDVDGAGQDRRLSALLDHVDALRPTHVYLKAYSQAPDATLSAYFPNRHFPLRADLFNRVAWQLQSRTDVKVFARLPASARGLAPQALAEVYEDLARHAAFNGLVFDDTTSPEQARSLAARAREFRAPLTIARDLGPGRPATRIVHEPLYPGDAPRTVVLLDAGDAGSALAHRMRALQLGGTIDFGYGTDRFLRNDPAFEEIAPAMSLRIFPSPPKPGAR